MILHALVLFAALAEAPTLDRRADEAVFDQCLHDVVAQRIWSGECSAATRDRLLASNGKPNGDWPRVLAVMEALPHSGSARQGLLNTLLETRLEEATRSLPEPRPTLSAEVDLEAARADLRRLREAIADGAEAEPAGPPLSFQRNQDAFEDALADALRGGGEQLRRFTWDSWCGTGIDLFVRPLHYLSAAKDAQRGEYAQAASVLLQPFGHRWDDEDGTRRRLIGAAGFDWERVYVGLVLEGRDEAATVLARHGSPHAARWLMTAAEERPEGPDPSVGLSMLLYALGAFVDGTDRCWNGLWISGFLVFREKPRADPEVQEQILALLERYVAPDSSQGRADAASLVLPWLCRTESLPAFRTMLRSPFPQVRERGRQALLNLGEPAPLDAADTGSAF